MFNWVKKWFGNKKTIELKECMFEASAEVYYKRLAIEVSVGLIANAISRCEIKTYHKGKNIRSNMYYLLNVQPNKNENATYFFNKAIRKLVYDGEALILMHNEEMFVADDWITVPFVFKSNIYKDVRIDDFTLQKVLHEEDVIHLKLSDTNIRNVVDGLYSSYGRLLASSMNYYRRKNNKRLLIKGDFLRAQDEETQEEIDAIFLEQLKNWFDPDKEGVAFQLANEFEMEDLSDGAKPGKGNSDSRDISNLIDDIFNYVAMAFHVPRGLLKGDLADIEKQTDNFIMFGVNPFAEMIADELNRKFYSKKEYLERTYLKIDTTKIRLTDLSKLATAIDKLFAVGAYTINDVIAELGGEPIEEEWANERYVTKNYEKASAKGGEE